MLITNDNKKYYLNNLIVVYDKKKSYNKFLVCIFINFVSFKLSFLNHYEMKHILFKLYN